MQERDPFYVPPLLGQTLWTEQRIRSADGINKPDHGSRYPKNQACPQLNDVLTFNLNASLEHNSWKATLAAANLLNTKE